MISIVAQVLTLLETNMEASGLPRGLVVATPSHVEARGPGGSEMPQGLGAPKATQTHESYILV